MEILLLFCSFSMCQLSLHQVLTWRRAAISTSEWPSSRPQESPGISQTSLCSSSECNPDSTHYHREPHPQWHVAGAILDCYILLQVSNWQWGGLFYWTSEEWEPRRGPWILSHAECKMVQKVKLTDLAYRFKRQVPPSLLLPLTLPPFSLPSPRLPSLLCRCVSPSLLSSSTTCRITPCCWKSSATTSNTHFTKQAQNWIQASTKHNPVIQILHSTNIPTLRIISASLNFFEPFTISLPLSFLIPIPHSNIPALHSTLCSSLTKKQFRSASPLPPCQSSPAPVRSPKTVVFDSAG